MLMDLEVIKLLRNTGEPLNLTVKEDGFNGVVITRDGGNSVDAKDISYREAVHQLEKSLFNYPHHVTIDEEMVDQAPFVDLARSTITTYPGDDQENTETNTIRFGYQNLSYHNALVGGVLCSLTEKRAGRRNIKYFAIDDERSGGEHWKKLKKVELSGVIVIDSPDIDQLEQRNRSQIEMSDALEQKVSDRVENQIKRTMKRPGVPVKYEGPMFHKMISIYEDHPFLSGAPIAVTTGTPMEICNPGEVTPENYSAAQAFYQNDSQLVPVHLTHEQKFDRDIPRLILEDFKFEVTGLDGVREQVELNERQEPHPARYVESVTLVYQTDDRHFADDEEEEKEDETIDTTSEWRIPAPFLMGGSEWENRDVRVVQRAQMDPEALAGHLALAYWRNFEEHNYDEVKEQKDHLNRCARIEVQHLENPNQGLLQEISEWLNRFSTDYPMPTTEIRINSDDGRMTMILHPERAPGTERKTGTAPAGH